MDLNGKVILESQNQTNNYYIRRNNMESGVYILKIMDKNNVINKKIIFE